jgi:DNA-binding FadR family transcriptional regulator
LFNKWLSQPSGIVTVVRVTAGYPTTRRHGEVVHELGRAVVRGDLTAGETLPSEELLAAEYGLSRGAFREAMKVLAGKGLVASRTRTGTVVLPEDRWNLMDPDVLAWRYQGSPTRGQLDDLAEVRVALEPEAARLAASRIRKAEVAALRGLLERMEGTLPDPDAFIEADLAFHQEVVRASGNELFGTLFGLLGAALAEVRHVHTRSLRRNQQTLPEHAAVVDALEAHDQQQSFDRMRQVVTEAAHDVRRARTPRKV